jgi:hypothetical protein
VAPSLGLYGAGLTTAHAGEHAARVAAFDNLGDDSLLDVRQTPSLKRVVEKVRLLCRRCPVGFCVVVLLYCHGP